MVESGPEPQIGIVTPNLNLKVLSIGLSHLLFRNLQTMVIQVNKEKEEMKIKKQRVI